MDLVKTDILNSLFVITVNDLLMVKKNGTNLDLFSAANKMNLWCRNIAMGHITKPNFKNNG